MATTTSKSSTFLRTPVLDYPTLGGIAAKWMRRNLVYGPGDLQGQPYELDPFLRLFLDDLYRVHPDTGQRIVRRGLLGVAKGNAKTEFEAAVDLLELAGPSIVDPHTGRAVPRPSPDIPVAAASYEQARLVFGAAMVMCEPIADLLDVYEKEITRKTGTGRMYRVAAATGTNDGLRPTSVSIDELHEWVGGKERVYVILTNGLTKRSDSFEMSITTAGDPLTSNVLHNLYEYGTKVAAGEIVDESFLMHWYEADDDLDLNDPAELREAIRQANPASFIDIDQVAARYEIDRVHEAEFRRYYLNQWVTGTDTWLPAGVWNDCYQAGVPAEGEEIVAAFDGSHNNDSTALIGCTPAGHLFTIGVWEKPDNDPNWKVPRSEVDAAVDDMFQKWDVLELACDPARWTLYMDEWSERYGEDRVVEFPQSRPRMAPATAKFYDATVGGLLTHDGSPTLTRHVANATVKPIPNGRYVLQKDHPDRKIDAAVAAVMAFDRATWRRDHETEVSVELW